MTKNALPVVFFNLLHPKENASTKEENNAGRVPDLLTKNWSQIFLNNAATSSHTMEFETTGGGRRQTNKRKQRRTETQHGGERVEGEWERGEMGEVE